MATVDDGLALRSDVSALREDVLDPIERAESALERERAEVEAERAAFRSFAERVREIQARRAPTAPRGLPVTRNGPTETPLKRVREAYRDSILSLDHYGEVYGEPLEVNLATELGRDLAATLCFDDGTAFTPLLKEQTVTAAVATAEERASFIADIDRERDDVADHRAALERLLEELDAGRVSPACQSFEDEIDALVRRRQETIRSQRSIDGRSLCGYLYDETPWNYPVLVAATRFFGTLSGER